VHESVSTANHTVEGDDAECERRVMHFFNNCDYVTLKKLTNLKWSFFRNLEPHSVMQVGHRGNRFGQLSDMIEHTGFKKGDCQQLDELIAKLRKADMSRIEIKKLKPDFKMPIANLNVG